MERAVIVAIVACALAPRLAHACTHGCTHPHGGHSSLDETITLELELALHSVEIPIGDPHAGLTTSVVDRTSRVTAVGGRIRFLIGGAPNVGYRWLYGGFELEDERILSSPLFADDASPFDVRMTSIIGVRVPIGIRTTIGAFQLSSELDPGFAGVFFGKVGGDAAVDLEARGRVAVWCGPGTTLGLGVGIDLADFGDPSVFVTLAGHFDPYDQGSRQ